jgi:hypothetical protein
MYTELQNIARSMIITLKVNNQHRRIQYNVNSKQLINLHVSSSNAMIDNPGRTWNQEVGLKVPLIDTKNNNNLNSNQY